MVATIKEKHGKLYCSNCRMRVENLDENAICEFCGQPFANWERMMEKYWQDVNIEEIKGYEGYGAGRTREL